VTRLDEELALLRERYADLDYRADGHWVRLPKHAAPKDLWQPSELQVAFQIPPSEGTAPYAFHVRSLGEVAVPLEAISGKPIGNYTHPTSTPWGTDWGTFSWAFEEWRPRNPITAGTTVLDFARSIADRLGEGA
jgi:hypothetical protein